MKQNETVDETNESVDKSKCTNPQSKKKQKKNKFDWLRPRSRRERAVLSTFEKTNRKREQDAFGRFYEGLIDVLHASFAQSKMIKATLV